MVFYIVGVFNDPEILNTSPSFYRARFNALCVNCVNLFSHDANLYISNN
jgi:hypothetical protein